MSTDAMAVREISARYLAEAADVQRVPAGYKQTEVGVIPEDWSVAKLGDICNAYSGGTPATSHPEYYGGDIPWITSSDLNKRTIFSVDGKITKSGLENSSAKMVESGTLLIALYGATAGVAAISKIYAAINQAVLAIIPKSVHTNFLYQYLTYKKDWIIQTFTQGGQPNLSGEIVKSLTIPVPHKKEQRAIAAALSDVDALIAALDKLIAKKRAIKTAAMQQLLTGKQRLPGFSGEWEVKRLGDFASIRNLKVLPSNVDPDTPCVELEHMGQGDGQLLECSTARYSTSSKYCFFSGDVLFGRLRSYLRKFWYADREGICTTEIWPLMVNPEQAFSGFLHAIVQTDWFIEAASISYGTHMPRADWGVMRNLEVRLPRIEEQTAIATVLSDMDAEIATLETRRDKIRALKQGMMQELLTGRTRLI